MKKQTDFRSGLSGFMHSIRFRLVLWFTVILALVLAIFSGIVYHNQYRDFRGDAFDELNRKVVSLEEITHNAIRRGNQQVAIPTTFFETYESVAILDSSRTVAASQGPEIPAATIQSIPSGFFTNPNEHSVYSWMDETGTHLYVAAPVEGTANFIVMAAPLDPSGFLPRLQLTLLVGSLLTLILALLGGFWLADRAMRPVHTITQTARSIGETDLSRRLDINTRDELGELAGTFNGMLERLEAAFERQRQFVSDASHELRTPLTIINLETSRALASRRTPQEYERALGVIHHENEFMTRMVNDLLTLARIDAGQAIIQKTPLDLSDIVFDAVERLMPLADHNGVHIESGDLPEVRILGDRQYLLQMASNLIENAIKYTTGEKRVQVETGLNGSEAWFRVENTGSGIAPEHIPHLFDRFYRVDESRSRGDDDENPSPGGSGLGLSITHWIVKAHGGDIRVESRLGESTTFEVRFSISQSVLTD
jgi:heavy metal sensor kinase